MILGSQRCSVVVVDDSADVRDIVRMALERTEDFRVVAVAGDGAAGLAAVVEHRPDVVLLDLSMPVMDGLETLVRIRAESPGTRVVVLSGAGDGPMVQQALDQGAVGYVQKGMSIHVMRTRLRALMGLATESVPSGSGPDRRVVEAWNLGDRPQPPVVPDQAQGED